MKKIKRLAIVALALAAIIFAVIYGVKLVNVIVLNWSAIVDWLTDASIMTASVCVSGLFLGYYLLLVVNSHYYQHGFARKIERITRASYSYLRESFFTEKSMMITGKTLIIISAIVFIANLFPLFNHFELFRLWLIIVGGIGIFGFGALMFFLVSDYEKSFWPVTLMSACLLGFTYYLDGFIISWTRPWITGITAIILTILYAIIGVMRVRETRKEKLEKAEYEAKTAKAEQEKSEKKAQYKDALKKRLSTLSFNDLIVSYFYEKKEDTLIHWNDIAAIYIEAGTNIKEDATKADINQKNHIAWLLSSKSGERPGNFIKLATGIFKETDIEALLFSNVQEKERILPEAFVHFADKKAVIASFLSQEFDENYKKVIYNKIKREFAPNELYGLMNALIYSYQKTWDEKFSEKLLARIKEIFTFANDCLDSMWQKGNRALLRKHLDAIYTHCILNGVHAQLPAIKQEPAPVEEPKA